MIKQSNVPTPPGPIYMRHLVYGTKSVQPEDREAHEDLGYVRLIYPTWVYHKQCPQGDIVCSTEVARLLEEGWVKSPAQLGEKPPDSSDTEITIAVNRLLSDKGLSQTALMRELGINSDSHKKRQEFKPTYTAILLKHKDRIVKRMQVFFWADSGAAEDDKA